MAKAVSKPESENEVYEVMKSYCQKKNFYFSEEHLQYLAEECYLFYESKRWKDTAYWPPLAMRWVLTHRFNKTKTSLNLNHNNLKVNQYVILY